VDKKLLVTGGCGYIGSHVARAFKEDNSNNKVYVVDRVRREHTLTNMDGWTIDDFASEESLATMVMLQPDIIVHCAGTSLVGPSMKNPAEYYDNNIRRTLRMLDVIRDMPNQPLIMFSSSASVYGNPQRVPIHERDHKDPISPYGNTKWVTELILRDYAAAYGINSVVFRYFNAAGAFPGGYTLGQEPGATHIVARVLEAAIGNKEFVLNGVDFATPDGTCIRDYVHVWDIARAHVMTADWAARENSQGSGLVHTFNLGTNRGISNQQIVEYVQKHYGLKTVVYGPRRDGDPDELVADSHLIRSMVGWDPLYSSIEDIVDSAYRWYTR
jgi:UDP-glucose 4-epimerase